MLFRHSYMLQIPFFKRGHDKWNVIWNLGGGRVKGSGSELDVCEVGGVPGEGWDPRHSPCH